MRYREYGFGMLALVTLALAGCGTDTPTQPATASPSSGTTPELAVASNSWIKRAHMPGARSYLTAATVTNAAGQSIVYAIGGASCAPNSVCSGLSTPVNTVTAYNVATNTWASKRRLPVPLAFSNGAGVINGKIYVSGGYTRYAYNSGVYPLTTRALYMYDPARNTWTRKRDMPKVSAYSNEKAGVGGVTGVIGGRLYVVTSCVTTHQVYGDLEGCTGYTPDGVLTPAALFFRYNPVTDQWTTLPTPFPEGASSPYAGGVIGGKFYVMQGWQRGYTHLSVYDPATNQWTPKTPLGLGRPGAATAVLGGKLYVIGGERNNNGLETVDITIVYDPVTDAWTRRAFLLSARAWTAATKVFLRGQPRIELVGGNVAEDNLQYVP
jgi:N-acetylneuraminic acid mutarotase